MAYDLYTVSSTVLHFIIFFLLGLFKYDVHSAGVQVVYGAVVFENN